MILRAALLALLPVPVLAQAIAPDAELAREAVARGEIRPLSEVLPRVETEFGGQVLDVELDNEDSLIIYEFEILTADARLIEVEVDAATGEILEVEDEDLDDQDDDVEGHDD